MNTRLFKVQDLLHKEIAFLLLKEIQNPLIKSITISGVKVSKDLKYSEIYEAREGLVAVEILDGSCGGCGAMVPPQLVNEAISQNIVYCGNCSRFLYKIEN